MQIFELTNEHAEQVAKLLNVKLESFFGSPESENAILTVKSGRIERLDYEETVYIYKTGQVSYFYNNGDFGGNGYENINALPITDYLRSEGYEFTY